MRQWIAEKQPLLEAAVRAWGRDPDDARRLSERLLVEAFIATSKGTHIEREVPWMAGTLTNLWSKLSATRHKQPRHLDETFDPGLSPQDSLHRKDYLSAIRIRILRAARLLPPPYGYVLYLQGVRDMSYTAIRAELCNYRPLGRDRVAQIVSQAHLMFRALLDGINPRAKWPQKYARTKNPWIATSLPPLAEQI